MRNSDMTNIRGNTLPASIPACRLSPAFWVIEPTRLGPNAPPKSPAIASIANSAVPPCGMRGDVRLIVPGHMMPTEKPQKTQALNGAGGKIEDINQRDQCPQAGYDAPAGYSECSEEQRGQ